MRRAFICPSKYVQGENELFNLGYFVRQYGTSALLVATKSSVKRVREALDATAAKFGVTFVETEFQGECSRDEIARLPRDVALDIGIFPEDAHHIAWTAVYGK
mgnify:CR=1 FL=1